MSEDVEHYGVLSEERTKLLFISKRLADIAKDLDKLDEEDKKFVIERVDKLNAIGLVQLYNALGEYMEWYYEWQRYKHTRY